MAKLTLMGTTFMCDDAATAAKIVDAITKSCTPVDYKYISDDAVAQVHGGRYMYYAKKIDYMIQPVEPGEANILSNLKEAEATIERIRGVLDEEAALAAEAVAEEVPANAA